jgi:DNA-binding CsgD family transcriptional regulator
LISTQAAANELVLLRGRIEFTHGSSVTAHSLLVQAARALSTSDPRLAATALLEAGRAAWNADDSGRLARTAEMLATLPLDPTDPLTLHAYATAGESDLLAGRLEGAVSKIRTCTNALVNLVSSSQVAAEDAGNVEALQATAGATRVTGDDSAGLTLGEWVVDMCRTRGHAGRLAWALVNLSMTQAVAGRHTAAVVNATEGLRLARDLRQPMAVCSCESVLAWLAAVHGQEQQCRELAFDAVQLAQTHQMPSNAVFATWALGLLDLTLDRPDEALDRLMDRTRGPLVVPTAMCLIVPDLIEAATRARRTDQLEGLFRWYERWAKSTQQPWAEAAVHRCQAMLTELDAEPHYKQALRLHEDAGPFHRQFDRARTQLLYGQWLRRARRRLDARAQLNACYEGFQRLGATPWADRAAAELRATGQATRQLHDSVASRLTPQEIRVVRLVAEGHSNRDVAAKLFLSPRTVAYHLYKAYPKLGIGNRAGLARIDLDALLTTPS